MSERLNTQDLIDLLVNRQGFERKEAENFMKEFFSLIEEGLEKDKIVKIKGLGTFKLINVESRESVNVNTGERIEIQGHTKISFTSDSGLRDIINKPFAHFETVVLKKSVEFNDLEEEQQTTETNIPPAEEVSLPQEIETKVTVDEQPEQVEQAEYIEKKENPSHNKLMLVVILITILLCGVLLLFTYWSEIFPPKRKPDTVINPPVEVVDSVVPISRIDSVEIIPTETIETPKIEETANNSTPQNKLPKGNIPFSKIPVKADSTSYEIVGTLTTHTIKDGQTLIRISYRYYGTKDFWPYLVMHNRSVITDPNNVPIGTTINIPELRKK